MHCLFETGLRGEQVTVNFNDKVQAANRRDQLFHLRLPLPLVLKQGLVHLWKDGLIACTLAHIAHDADNGDERSRASSDAAHAKTPADRVNSWPVLARG